ncbi:MAG: flagellar biosynthesis protein FlhB [Deltaproteobacteria bacterium]|nr:flagellar biosynthesis protein FlhB [Deltaproteobacteria bacterium]
MAEYEERSLDDLTEEPTPHRLEELRAKGRVAQSRELTSAIVLLGVLLTLYYTSGKFITSITGLMTEVFSKDLARPLEVHNWSSFTDIALRCGKVLAMAFLPVAGAAVILGTLTSVVQSGFIFATETLQPDFDRVNPISGFKRLFSLKSLVEGAKSVLKFAVLIGAVYSVIKARIFIIPNTVALDTRQLLAYIGDIAMRAFGVAGILLLAAAGIDYFIQWRRHRRMAMMSKSEAKHELKEREGDPQIKARIRSIQREVARKRMMKSVPKADVVVTNPTHFAVAIVYDPDNHVAPKVVAKGADFLAQKIKEVARANGVPLVENVALARTLYKYVKVGQMIPRSLYQAVAEVLAYVYRLKGKRPEKPAEQSPEAGR